MNFKQLVLAFFSFISFFSFSQMKDGISYDLSCLETDIPSSLFSFFGDIEKEAVQSFGSSVSLTEEKSLGNESLIEIKKTYSFINTGDKFTNLEKILEKLKSKIKDPKGFDYVVYLLDTTLLNAFAVGGNIFFTTGMYDFCLNDDERASIIGHEISHNELGHINDNIKRTKTANEMLGADIGKSVSFVGTIITMPFNQKNEAHCDLVGADIAYAANYNPCAGATLWERMSRSESELLHIFSTHPYSLKRADCSKNHLLTNYNKACD